MKVEGHHPLKDVALLNRTLTFRDLGSNLIPALSSKTFNHLGKLVEL